MKIPTISLLNIAYIPTHNHKNVDDRILWGYNTTSQYCE